MKLTKRLLVVVFFGVVFLGPLALGMTELRSLSNTSVFLADGPMPPPPPPSPWP